MNDPPQNVDFGYGSFKENSCDCPVCKNGIKCACVYFPSVPNLYLDRFFVSYDSGGHVYMSSVNFCPHCGRRLSRRN